MSLLAEIDTWCEGLGPRGMAFNPPLPSEHIARVERRLRRPLPPSYRQFLSEADGGAFPRSFLDGSLMDLEVHSFTRHDEPIFVGIFDEMRASREMPVEFLPLASDGTGAIYGFLLGKEGADGEWAVARFDLESVSLQPVGSSFRSLMYFLCLEQRLLFDDAGCLIPEGNHGLRERRRELHRLMVDMDPRAPFSLKWLADDVRESGGEASTVGGLLQRAADADEAFTPAWASLALHFRDRDVKEGAVRCAAQAFLGRGLSDGPRGISWEALRKILRVGPLPKNLLPEGSPLTDFVLSNEPWSDPGARLRLADALEAGGDLLGAVREAQASLYLVTDDREVAPLFDRLERWLRRASRELEADLARRDGNVYLDMSASMSLTLDELDFGKDR